jgi:ribose transport system substrate-binding protein
VAEETLKANPELDAVATLTSTSTLSALSALGNIRPSRRISVVAFDQDSLAFDDPSLDSVVLEDTRTMGAEAIQLIVDKLHGRSAPGTTNLEPILVTRENVNSEEVRRLTSMEWRPAPLVRAWSRVQ